MRLIKQMDGATQVEMQGVIVQGVREEVDATETNRPSGFSGVHSREDK
jgi:hypothetical protein